jgi:hypothetical protein
MPWPCEVRCARKTGKSDERLVIPRGDAATGSSIVYIEIAGVPYFALFKDPAGNVMGLVKG